MTPQQLGEMDKSVIKTITCSFGDKASPFRALQLAILRVLEHYIVFSQLECNVCKSLIAEANLFKLGRSSTPTLLIYTNNHYMYADTICILVNHSGATIHNAIR